MAQLTRRNFVKGAALGAVAAGAMSAATAWAEEAASADDVAWDGEYDVVVLGLGGAGANAAVAAYEEGAKVLVCEKAPEGQEPCNTKASGQFVIATDDAEALYGYFSQLMGSFHNWDEEALRGMCEGAAGNWEWMTGPMGGDPDVICPHRGREPRRQVPDGGRPGRQLAPRRRRLGPGPQGLHLQLERVPRDPRVGPLPVPLRFGHAL